MGNQPEIWWFSVGLLLIIADLLVGSFFLLFLGVGALITGLSIVFGVNAVSMEWLIFGISSAILALVFRKPLLARFGPNSDKTYDEHQGELIEIIAEENEHGLAKAKYKGSNWSVKSASTRDLKIGEKLKIAKMEGITIVVDSHLSKINFKE